MQGLRFPLPWKPFLGCLDLLKSADRSHHKEGLPINDHSSGIPLTLRSSVTHW